VSHGSRTRNGRCSIARRSRPCQRACQPSIGQPDLRCDIVSTMSAMGAGLSGLEARS
jgi:hypothetical protein